MKITIRTDGEPGTKRLQSKFKKLARGLKNRRTLMNRIGVQLLNAVARNFKDQGHEGTPWEALKPHTLARRRTGKGVKKGRGRGRILEDTGKLRGSFAKEATNDSVRVGSNVEYAPTHEFGSGPVPRRKMLPSVRVGLQTAIDVTESYVAEQTAKAGLKGGA